MRRVIVKKKFSGFHRDRRADQLTTPHGHLATLALPRTRNKEARRGRAMVSVTRPLLAFVAARAQGERGEICDYSAVEWSRTKDAEVPTDDTYLVLYEYHIRS